MEPVYTLSEPQVWAIAVACAMMLFDVVMGFSKAVINGKVSSSKMRVGLGHKVVLLLIIAVSIVLEAGMQHVAGLGFGGVTVTVVCAYIIAMEVASIMRRSA